LSQWATLITLAKLGTPTIVGQFSLSLAVTAPILMMAGLNLRAVQATDSADGFGFADYFTLRVLTTLLALLVTTTIALLYARPVRWVIILVGIAKSIEAVSDIFYGFFQRHERMRVIAHSLIVRGALSVLAVMVGMALGRSLIWGCVGLAAAWAVVLAKHDVPNALTYLRTDRMFNLLNASSVTMRKLVILALPTGLVTTLLSFCVNLPRYFLDHYQGPHELGIFAAISYLVVSGTTIIVALGQSVTPRLSRLYSGGDYRAFVALLKHMIFIALALGLLGILVSLLAGPELLSLIYSREYAQDGGIFVILMFSAAIGYCGAILGFGLTSTRIFDNLMVPYLVLTAFSVVVCWALVRNFGLRGAAWATCVLNVGICVVPLYLFHQNRGDRVLAGEVSNE
jgi:O-antigen/teichoic acid export membrane protein